MTVRRRYSSLLLRMWNGGRRVVGGLRVGKKDAVTRIPSSQYAQCCWVARPTGTEITLAENEGLDVALDVGVSGGTGYPGTPYE